MPIELSLSTEPEYRITNRPGFEDVVFTESSDNNLILPDAVAYAKERDALLQSVRDAAAFRVEAQGEHNSNRYQATRTASAYVKLDGTWYVAFDDAPDAARNIILGRAQEGYDSHRQHNTWALPKNDEYVKGMLSRAERGARIVEVAESLLELATKSVNGKSEFGSHPSIQALLGDVSEDYAAFLNEQNHARVFVYVLTPKTLEDLGIGDRTEIRAAGLGVVDFDYLGSVSAGQRFDYVGGLARGVRRAREISRK